jgi:hypothetical protein
VFFPTQESKVVYPTLVPNRILVAEDEAVVAADIKDRLTCPIRRQDCNDAAIASRSAGFVRRNDWQPM